MNGQFSQTTRRLIALLLLFSVIVLVFAVAVFPAWRIYAQDRDAIPEYQAKIERFNQIAEKREALEAAVTRLEAARTETTSLLPEPTATLAAAALQERVKSAVNRSGGKLISTQVLAVSNDDRFSEIGVGIRVSTSIGALREILYSLESGEPHVVIENLMILARQKRGRDRKQYVQSDLDVRFNLYGLMVADGEPGAEQ